MAKLLEGKPISARLKAQLSQEITEFGKGTDTMPKLTSISVGEDPGSSIYMKVQERTARELGVGYAHIKLPRETSHEKICAHIRELNQDAGVNGILLQMPLPAHLKREDIILNINPDKDVEGVHPQNTGRLLSEKYVFRPCTAAAVMELIAESVRESGEKLRGKEAVVIGHSDIVGKPVAMLLLEQLATVTICHIATSERNKLQEHVQRAQILVVAVGKPGLIKGEWIRPHAVVVDVGISRVEGKTRGDVCFEEAEKRADFITPVPGGVGPLTVMMLMRNLLVAWQLQNVKKH